MDIRLNLKVPFQNVQREEDTEEQIFKRKRVEILQKVRALLDRMTLDSTSAYITKTKPNEEKETLGRRFINNISKKRKIEKKEIEAKRKKDDFQNQLEQASQKRQAFNLEVYEQQIATTKKQKSELTLISQFNLKLVEQKKEPLQKIEEKVEEVKNEISDLSWAEDEVSADPEYDEMSSKRNVIMEEAKNRPITRSISMYSCSFEQIKKKRLSLEDEIDKETKAKLANLIRERLSKQRQQANLSDDEH